MIIVNSMLSSIKGYAIGAAFLVPILAFMWLQNKSLTAANEAYISKVQQQDLAIKAKDKVNESILDAIDEWEFAQHKLLKTIEELKKVSLESKHETRKLTDVFSKHNLGKLAARKPTLIEKRINRGTADALRMLECATGATHRSCDTKDKNTESKTVTAKSRSGDDETNTVESIDVEYFARG